VYSTYFPYCNFDKLRISGANGIKFRLLNTEGSFFEGDRISDGCFYNDSSNCGFAWEAYSQLIPCDGEIRFQFQWCYPVVPLVHLFQDDVFVYEFIPTLVYTGAYDIYEQITGFGCESDFCGTCLDMRICTFEDGAYRYHAKSEPIHVSDSHECLVGIEYWNDDNYDGMYFCNGFRNIVYVQAQFLKFAPVETSTVYITSNNRKRVISKNIGKKRTLDINYVPEYVHDILVIAFSMDNTLVDNDSYTLDTEYVVTENEVKYSMWKASIELYQNLYKFENSNCDNECGGNQPAIPACVSPDCECDDVFGGDASSFI
jgi:hypothetical protein